MVAVYNVLIGPSPTRYHSQTTSPTGSPLDDTTDAVALLMLVPRPTNTGNPITDIGVLIPSIAGTSPTYRIAIESINNGPIPSGTILTNSLGNPIQIDHQFVATGWQWLSFPANNRLDNLAAGSEICVTVRYLSGTINASNSVNISHRIGTLIGRGHPTTIQNLTGTWVVSTPVQTPIISVRYQDGWIAKGTLPISDIGFDTFAQNTTPDERGLLWTPFADMRLVGCKLLYRPNGGTNVVANVNLYDSADTLLASRNLDTDHMLPDTGSLQNHIGFGQINVTGGQQYRITVEPTTTGTNNVRIFTYRFASQAELRAVSDMYLTERTNFGSWTNYNNATNGWRTPCITPVVDDITLTGGAGGGLLVHPGTSGGARG